MKNFSILMFALAFCLFTQQANAQDKKMPKPRILDDKTWTWEGSKDNYAKLNDLVFEVGMGNHPNGGGAADAGIEIENAGAVKVIVDTPLPFIYMDNASFAGFMVDYHTTEGYTKRVGLALGLYSNKRDVRTPIWGKCNPPDQFVDLGKKKEYDLDLKKWAPEGWDGKVWFSVSLQNSGRNTRLKARAELLGEQERPKVAQKSKEEPAKKEGKSTPTFVPLDLSDAATVASTRIFNQESLVFPQWGRQTHHGIPFMVIDPDGGKFKNAICLYSALGAVSSKMPSTVRLGCDLPAKEVHVLGAAGWGVPWFQAKNTLSMVMRVEYADGDKEDHQVINGVHLTDWAKGPDVPGSKNIGVLQVRYFSIVPKRQDAVIRFIEFRKGTDKTSPLVMALTVESPMIQVAQKPKEEKTAVPEKVKKESDPIVGRWVERRPGTPLGDRIRTFQPDGILVFHLPKSKETVTGTWRREGNKVYFSHPSTDGLGTATKDKWFIVVSVMSDELVLLMEGDRRFTWFQEKIEVAQKPKEEPARKSGGKDDKILMQGTWHLVDKKFPGGKEVPKDDARWHQTLEINGNVLRLKVKALDRPAEGTFQLTPTDKPKSIDFSGKGPKGFDMEFAGIYEISENTLKLSIMYGPNAKTNRVREFDGPNGGDYFVFKRSAEKIEVAQKPKEEPGKDTKPSNDADSIVTTLFYELRQLASSLRNVKDKESVEKTSGDVTRFADKIRDLTNKAEKLPPLNDDQKQQLRKRHSKEVRAATLDFLEAMNVFAQSITRLEKSLPPQTIQQLAEAFKSLSTVGDPQRVGVIGSWQLFVPEDTDVTWDYFPLPIGQSRIYETELTSPQLEFRDVIRHKHTYQQRGVIERTQVKSGLRLDGQKEVMWVLEENQKKPSQTVRENIGFIEVGTPDKGGMSWEPILKLFAKDGESWEWKSADKTFKYEVKVGLKHKGRPAVQVTRIHRSGGFESIDKITYVRGVGEVEATRTMTKDGRPFGSDVKKLVESAEPRDVGKAPKDAEMITPDYFPHKPGATHQVEVAGEDKIDNELLRMKKGQIHVSRHLVVQKENGVIHTTVVKKGLIPPGDTRITWDTTPAKDKPFVRRLRQSEDAIEVAHDSDPTKWLPELKLGAKDGDTWERSFDKGKAVFKLQLSQKGGEWVATVSGYEESKDPKTNDQWKVEFVKSYVKGKGLVESKADMTFLVAGLPPVVTTRTEKLLLDDRPQTEVPANRSVITSDYLPHQPGATHQTEVTVENKGDNPFVGKGEIHVSRHHVSHKDKGVIETVLVKKGIIRRGEPRIIWDAKPYRELLSFRQYRQTEAFIEVTRPSSDKQEWLPELKLGAKSGDSWEKTSENGKAVFQVQITQTAREWRATVSGYYEERNQVTKDGWKVEFVKTYVKGRGLVEERTLFLVGGIPFTTRTERRLDEKHQNHEEVLNMVLSLIEEGNLSLNNATDKESAEKASDALMKTASSLKDAVASAEKLGPPSDEQIKALRKNFAQKLKEATRKSNEATPLLVKRMVSGKAVPPDTLDKLGLALKEYAVAMAEGGRVIGSWKLFEKGVTEVTSDYYPFTKGSSRFFDVELTLGGDNASVMRSKITHLDNGRIESTIVKIGLKKAGDADVKWLQEANQKSKDPRFFRERDGFIEIGTRFEGAKDFSWEPILKLGAKDGDTWEWKNIVSTSEYRLKTDVQHKGRPAIQVTKMTRFPGLEIETTAQIVYVEGVGEVEFLIRSVGKDGKEVPFSATRLVEDEGVPQRPEPERGPKAGAELLKVDGQLTNDDPKDRIRKGSVHKVHTVKMLAGKSYTIDLVSRDFDAYLRLEDSAGTNLAEDDDSGGFPDARIVFQAPKDDTYRIIATTYDRKVGRYTLTVKEGKGPAANDKAPAKLQGPIPGARKLVARVKTTSKDNMDQMFTQHLQNLSVSITDKQVVLDFDVDGKNWQPVTRGFSLLVRVFDKDGKYLTHFVTKESYTASPDVHDAWMTVVNRLKDAPPNVQAEMLGGFTPKLLQANGNRLIYGVNPVFLQNAAIVEVGLIHVKKKGPF